MKAIMMLVKKKHRKCVGDATYGTGERSGKNARNGNRKVKVTRWVVDIIIYYCLDLRVHSHSM